MEQLGVLILIFGLLAVAKHLTQQLSTSGRVLVGVGALALHVA